MEALEVLEKEKNISKDTLLEAIEQSLIQACKNHFGILGCNTAELFGFDFYRNDIAEFIAGVCTFCIGKGDLHDRILYQINNGFLCYDFEITSLGVDAYLYIICFAKNVILQKIREEERKVLFDQYFEKEHDVVTGVVQRYVGRNVSINLGKVDALLTENEQVKGEKFEPTQRVKVYVLEVKNTTKGPKVMVSRTHPELVKRLFESEVSEVAEGIVEIKSIAREAGSRTKMAVWSNDPNVDAVGACVGMNGSRVNAVVNELNGEKIDIITWDENPALLIENALSPAKVISVMADPDEKTAKVIVPDYQLSLAIGKEGQNARLAARLTGFKIDIKSETQAREAGDFDYVEEEEYEEEGNYDESAAEEETISAEENFDENDVETAEKAGDEE